MSRPQDRPGWPPGVSVDADADRRIVILTVDGGASGDGRPFRVVMPAMGGHMLACGLAVAAADALGNRPCPPAYHAQVVADPVRFEDMLSDGRCLRCGAFLVGARA